MVAQIVASAVAKQGLASAFALAGRTIEAGFFLNVAWACIAFAIWIAGWVAQFVVGWLLWKVLMCCHPHGYYSDHHKTDSAKHVQHVPVPIVPPATSKKNDDLQEVVIEGANGSTRVPVNAPIWSTLDAKGVPRLLPKESVTARRIGVPISHTAPPVPVYKHVVIPFIPDKKQWHGHGRSLYESYVRLVVITIRVLIVMLSTIISFSVAGVNFYSLVTGFGLVSISFSYAAAGMISNVFSAIYMYSTSKLEMHDYVSIGPINGEVTAFLSQWIEITDDSQPWKGRMIHQIPNKVPMEMIVTIYPNGPGIAILKSVKEDLEAIDRWIESNPYAMQQLQAQHMQGMVQTV